ncbi:transposase [bacterium]|nr:transposase [bacterium]
MPRQERLDMPGTLHHVMVRGIEKRNIVNDDTDRFDFVRRMNVNSIKTKTIIYAWALMNNHAHILLRSGPQGLSHYMRCLLTGYAVVYNLRHKRHGHLFQNRYKSIICEEDSYFKELVRYIHLNPLRAGLVKNIDELVRYKWSGHGVIMGYIKNEAQDCEGVLSWFGKKKGAARKNYDQYVQEGIHQGRRLDLVGGGLVRSQGGWFQVISMKCRKHRELADDRILGGGTFVENILKEANERVRSQFIHKPNKRDMAAVIKEECHKQDVSFEMLKTGSRQADVVKLRVQLALYLTREWGISLAEAARQLGITTAGIHKMLSRKLGKSLSN